MTSEPAGPFDRLRFLRSLQADLPEFGGDEDEATILERLQAAQPAGDESWIATALEREHWIAHVLHRLDVGAAEYGNRSLQRPLVELLGELSDEAADLGAWGALAQQVLDGCGGIEPSDRELLSRALRQAATAGAEAWARIDQARALLATIDGGAS